MAVSVVAGGRKQQLVSHQSFTSCSHFVKA